MPSSTSVQRTAVAACIVFGALALLTANVLCCCCCRWYFDVKTRYYYGGDPVSWTQQPSIPSAALFGVAPFEGGDAATQAAAQAAAAAAAASHQGSATAGAAGGSKPGAGGGAAAAAAAGQGVRVVKKVVQLPSHPLAGVGGHAMPVSGRIGGAKGVGIADPAAAAAADVMKVSWAAAACAVYVAST
eukprot:GHRQ01021146.1.p1 GENE.GHRQ01021146.1~~GHRQ01021146.1.p1  ORF type:complete len:187 (-),score=75.85 GHRQ01021146.1:271-831(-)